MISRPGGADVSRRFSGKERDDNELWSRTYGGPLDEFTGAFAQTPNGGYVLGGNIVDPNDRVADPGAAGYGGFEGRSNLDPDMIDYSVVLAGVSGGGYVAERRQDGWVSRSTWRLVDNIRTEVYLT